MATDITQEIDGETVVVGQRDSADLPATGSTDGQGPGAGRRATQRGQGGGGAGFATEGEDGENNPNSGGPAVPMRDVVDGILKNDHSFSNGRANWLHGSSGGGAVEGGGIGSPGGRGLLVVSLGLLKPVGIELRPGSSDHGGIGCGGLWGGVAYRFEPMDDGEIINVSSRNATGRGGPGGMGYVLRFCFNEYDGTEIMNVEGGVLGDWLLIPGDVVRPSGIPFGDGGPLML